MSNTAEQLQQIEVTLEQAKEAVSLSSALDRLSKNRDFKRIVEKGFFEEESIRLVMLKSAPSMQSPERQANIIKEIDSIGCLKQYFHAISVNGMHAMAAIQENEAERDLILAEDLEA